MTALASRARVEREVHDEPRWDKRAIVHETQEKTGCHLSDLIAIGFVNREVWL